MIRAPTGSTIQKCSQLKYVNQGFDNIAKKNFHFNIKSSKSDAPSESDSNQDTKEKIHMIITSRTCPEYQKPNSKKESKSQQSPAYLHNLRA